jgi:hypothetical protein
MVRFCHHIVLLVQLKRGCDADANGIACVQVIEERVEAILHVLVHGEHPCKGRSFARHVLGHFGEDLTVDQRDAESKVTMCDAPREWAQAGQEEPTRRVSASSVVRV